MNDKTFIKITALCAALAATAFAGSADVKLSRATRFSGAGVIMRNAEGVTLEQLEIDWKYINANGEEIIDSVAKLSPEDPAIRKQPDATVLGFWVSARLSSPADKDALKNSLKSIQTSSTKLGVLAVTSTPTTGAEVSIDTKPKGETDSNLPLKEGTYTVTATLNGKTITKSNVKIVPKKTTKVQFDF